MRALALTAILLMPQAHGQEDSRPLAGVDTDEVRLVKLASQVPTRCVELVQNGVSILLPEDDLRELAARKPVSWANESERLALIRGSRAESILAEVEAQAGPGCRTSRSASADSMHLVAEMLEKGEAAVRSKDGRLLESASVRYLGRRCGPLCGRGDIMFSEGAGKVFLIVDWWVS